MSLSRHLVSLPSTPCLTKLWFLGNIFKFENKSFINFSLPGRAILLCSENTSPSKIYDRLGKFWRQKIWIFETIQSGSSHILFAVQNSSLVEIANLLGECRSKFCAASAHYLNSGDKNTPAGLVQTDNLNANFDLHSFFQRWVTKFAGAFARQICKNGTNHFTFSGMGKKRYLEVNEIHMITFRSIPVVLLSIKW